MMIRIEREEIQMLLQGHPTEKYNFNAVLTGCKNTSFVKIG